ncbi:MAG: bleomycin resistance protein [Paracoccaceae bacterium]|nr:MAG: bleomycin resistance protein [Paracoccaceae bacterium]
MIPGLGAILETCIYAPDLDAAEAFYGGILGLRRHARAGDRHLFYRCGGQMLLIFNPAATERPDPAAPLPVPPHGARGPGHLCLRSNDLDATRAALTGAGIRIEAELTWPGGGRSIYVRDPAGNSVEFAEARIWGL